MLSLRKAFEYVIIVTYLLFKAVVFELCDKRGEKRPACKTNGHLNQMASEVCDSVPRNPYLQFLYSLSRSNDIDFASFATDDIIPTFDGQRIAVDWITHNKRQDTLVFIMLGFGGCRDSQYIKHWDRIGAEYQWSVCVMTRRGHDDRVALDPSATNFRLPSYDESCDIETALVYIQAKYVHEYKKIYLVGYSSGSNHVFCYAGKSHYKYSDKVAAVVGVNAALDVPRYVEHVRSMRALDGMFYTAFRHIIERNRDAYLAKGVINIDNLIKRCTSMYEFEEHVSKALGYVSVPDMMHAAQAPLMDIKVPMLLVASRDDFFMPPYVLESHEALSAYASKTVVLTEYGSHLSWHDMAINYIIATYLSGTIKILH